MRIIISCIIVFIVGPAIAADTHPDTSRYEYLAMNGYLVPPHSSFPKGTERANWLCFDKATEVTYKCTFVRTFDGFQYVFRPRR